MFGDRVRAKRSVSFAVGTDADPFRWYRSVSV